jgi:hypothetical protein
MSFAGSAVVALDFALLDTPVPINSSCRNGK